jgi:hypothetical protein
MKYFNAIPKIAYNNPITGNPLIMTNIMQRVSVVAAVLNNPLLYYEYDIQEGDTPDIVAYKYYGDPYRYWLVLFANQYLDPQFDWPLNYGEFGDYINNQYTAANSVISATANTITVSLFDLENIGGSIPGSTINVTYTYNGAQITDTKSVLFYSSDTQSNTANLTIANYFTAPPSSNGSYNLFTYNTIYEYQKITTQYNRETQTTDVSTIVITQSEYNSLPSSTTSSYILPDGQVDVTVTKTALSYYDWELKLNEAKRSINLINSSYVDEFERQFKKLMAT